jgi:hypothetical protein
MSIRTGITMAAIVMVTIVATMIVARIVIVTIGIATAITRERSRWLGKAKRAQPTLLRS